MDDRFVFREAGRAEPFQVVEFGVAAREFVEPQTAMATVRQVVISVFIFFFLEGADHSPRDLF